MRINSKIANVPFFILYLILTALFSVNWVQVILFQKDFEAFRATQPWDYYLSHVFAETFGTSQREYFMFMFPILLVGLYALPKVLGKLMSLDKKSNIKGDNHIATLIILLVAPSILGMPVLSGLVLVIAFSLLSFMDEQKTR